MSDMIKLFLSEGIGSSLLAMIVLVCVDSKNKNIFPGDSWIKIGLGLAFIIVIFGPISGSHVNPLLSLMFYLNDQLSLENLGIYVTAQLLGAVIGLTFFKYYKDSYIKDSA